MKKITPFLWFDGNAEAAVRFYASVFKDFKRLGVTHYTEAGPEKKGTVLTISFRILGQEFVALNGKSDFKFSMATSFMVTCRTQKELDYYWRKLSAGGEEVQCGWLTDKFGVTWQVTPAVLMDMIADKNPRKVAAVMKAVMTMVKLDISALKEAYREA